MSLNLGVMYAGVALEDADYRKTLKGLEGASESTFKKVATLAAGYLTLRGIYNFADNAIKTFSDLQEETNKFNVVFKNMGAETNRVLADMQKNFGLSELAAKKMLAGTGDILTGFDFDKDVALALSEGTVKLGADLASFSNYSGGARGASLALTKAMLGETEAAKLLGIVIRQDDKDYKALIKQAMTTGVTIEALGKTFTVESEKQAKAVAALAMAYKQSPNAIGDFVRSQHQIANQQRILRNNFEELYSTIGSDASGPYSDALRFSNSLLTSYNNLNPASRQLTNNTIALTAAFALMAKTGILAGMNKTIGSVGGLSGIQQQTEANLVAATEEFKRAEYAKTDAFREAHTQAQSIRIARIAVQEQDAAIASAKAQIAAAEASGDATQVLAAKKQLATATKNLTKAQLAESTATQQLAVKHNIARTASVRYTVAKKAETLATKINTKAATAAGKAKLAMTASMGAAKTAAMGLYSALGPVGVAMIALSGAYMAYQYISEKHRNELEGQITLTNRNAEASMRAAEVHKKEREENNARMDRLKELSKYERLNNSEKTEAERLIDLLTKKYGDLGIEIDDVTGKLNVGTDAWKKFNDAQAKELSDDLNNKLKAGIAQVAAMQNSLRSELSSFWKDSMAWQGAVDTALSITNVINPEDKNAHSSAADKLRATQRQQELDSIQKLRTIKEQIAAFEKMRNSFTEKNNKKEAAAVDAIIKKLKEQQEIQKRLNDLNQARKRNKKIDVDEGDTGDSAARKQSKAERRAMTSLEKREWGAKFDAASVEKQVSLIDNKIQKVFQKQSGKYASLDEFKKADHGSMTEQELKDLQEIIELEEKRAQIRKRSADAFESERKSYERYLEDRDEKKKDQAVERKIKKAQDSGDKEAVNSIMQRELELARAAARNLQGRYEKAVQDAEADGILTEKEKKNVQELKRKMQDAMSDEDKWDKRVLDEKEKDDQNQKVAVAWSSELLTAQLGGTVKPQEETAKNTKRSMELLRDIKDNLNDGEVLA